MNNHFYKNALTSTEFLVAILLALITGFIGYFTENLIDAIFVGILEITLGLIAWTYKDFKNQISTIAKDTQLFSHLNQLDISGRTKKAFLDITDSLMQFKDNSILLLMHISKLESHAMDYKVSSVNEKFHINLNFTTEDVYNAFLQFVDILPEGSTYYTLSCVDFWSKGTIGHPLFFQTKISGVARERNINFKRVILLEKPFEELSEFSKRVLREHLNLSQKQSRIETKIAQLKPGESVDQIGNFAVIECPSGQFMVIQVNYQMMGGVRQFSDVSFYTVMPEDVTTKSLKYLIINDLLPRFNTWYKDRSVDIYKFFQNVNTIKLGN